jgi:hypothetical protein
MESQSVAQAWQGAREVMHRHVSTGHLALDLARHALLGAQISDDSNSYEKKC